MKVLLLDNYDSFTYNLYQLLKKNKAVKQVAVKRNDQIAEEEVSAYDKVVLSPGPGIPQEAGNMLNIIKAHAEKIPFLGVCLGHQALGEAFGAKLYNLENVHHGVSSEIFLKEEGLFAGLPPRLTVGRYHSWVIQEDDFPRETLNITARGADEEIMAIAHKKYPVFGIQFHPESIMTPMGNQIIENFLSL